MCHDSEMFTTLHTCEKNTVRLGDSHEVEYSQMGTIDVIVSSRGKGHNAVWLRLLNVLYVPTLDMNVLSVSALDSKKMRVSFCSGHCDIEDANTSEPLATGTRRQDGL